MRLLVLAGVICGTLSAQWIHYPTKGVPRHKDGKPDFSGMWMMQEGLPCPKLLADDIGGCLEKSPLSPFAADLAKAVPGGLPLRPNALALIEERRKSGIDPHVRCMPSNFPRMFTLPHITKFAETPGLLILMNEYNASYRQIFTDGRPLPEDPQPSWNGYTTARWEGDTLVAETNGFRDNVWMDMSGTPLTSAAHVTERFRRPNFGTLEIEATVDDPTMYTKPWTMKLTMSIVIDTEQMDEVCLEGEDSAKHMTAQQTTKANR